MACLCWRVPHVLSKLTENHKNLRALELDNQDIFGDGNAISSLARMEVTFTVYSFKKGEKSLHENVDIFLGWAAGFLAKILRHFAAGILRLGSYFFLSLVHQKCYPYRRYRYRLHFPKGPEACLTCDQQVPARCTWNHLVHPMTKQSSPLLPLFPRCPSCEWEATQGRSWRPTWEERRFHGGHLLAFLHWPRVWWEDWPIDKADPLEQACQNICLLDSKTCVFSFALLIWRLVKSSK